MSGTEVFDSLSMYAAGDFQAFEAILRVIPASLNVLGNITLLTEVSSRFVLHNTPVGTISVQDDRVFKILSHGVPDGV